MYGVEYRPDHRGTAKLMQTPEMQAVVAQVCHDAIPAAQRISPDAPPYGEGYIASFEVDAGHLERIAGTRRATAYLVNTSDHAAAVEWGNGNHVLARTADMIEGII